MSAGVHFIYMSMLKFPCVSAASHCSLTHTTQSLEKDVQEVKAALQAMLAQLKEEEEEEEVEELQDDDVMQNGTEEEEDEEEEDQYFSDSWDI